MNKKARRRLAMAGGIVAIALLVIVAVATSGGSAASIGVDEVLSGDYEGKRVQVTGSVVADSISSEGSDAVFAIEPEDAAGARDTGSLAGASQAPGALKVRYGGALPSTFGTGVVAICTGTVEGGELNATEMVAKCPSKYESAEGSLTVKGLLDQAGSMTGKEVKVCGYVQGEPGDAQAEVRFVIESQGALLNVAYEGGLDEAIADGTAVVIEGSLGDDGLFHATAQPAIDSTLSE